VSNRTTPLNDATYNYLLEHGLREPDVLCRLRLKTAEHEFFDMQISPEQGQFMRVLIEVLGARRALEIGTFTGYSTLCVALALPKDGALVACERRETWVSLGKPYWVEAGVDDMIDLRIGKAVSTLDDMINVGEQNSYDFAFIDADKKNYLTYYEQCLTLLRPGGVLAIDNVLWGGRLVDDTLDDRATIAIRELNDRIHHDERVSMCMLPVGDGLTLARKVENSG